MTAPDFAKQLSDVLDEKLSTLKDTIKNEVKSDLAVTHKGASLVASFDDGTTVEKGADGKVKVKGAKGLTAAGCFRVMVAAHRTGRNPADLVKEWAANPSCSRKDKAHYAEVQKALQAGSAADGGFLVPEPVMEEVVDLLRAASVMDVGGANIVAMPNGSLSGNYVETDILAAFVDECEVLPSSSPTFARWQMLAKKLAALVPICNEWLTYAQAGSSELVRNILVQALASKKDLALLTSDGSQNTPKGLLSLAVPGNVFPRTLDGGNVTLATISNDLSAMAAALELQNIPMQKPVWIMSPRTKWFLFRETDGNGNWPFQAMLSQGQLFGYPVLTSTSIPTNLGSGGDESVIILVDMAQILIGEARDLEIEMSSQASASVGGQVIGFGTDVSFMRGILAFDQVDLYRGKSICVLTQVDWF